MKIKKMMDEETYLHLVIYTNLACPFPIAYFILKS